MYKNLLISNYSTWRTHTHKHTQKDHLRLYIVTLKFRRIFPFKNLQLTIDIKITSTLHLWASLMAQLVKNLPAMQETWVWSLDWEDTLEKGMGTLYSSVATSLLLPRGAWQTTAHQVTKSQTQLSYFHFHFTLHL